MKCRNLLRNQKSDLSEWLIAMTSQCATTVDEISHNSTHISFFEWTTPIQPLYTPNHQIWPTKSIYYTSRQGFLMDGGISGFNSQFICPMPAVFFGSSAHSIIEYNFLRGEPSISYFEILISVILYQYQSTLNIDLILWQTQLIVCAENGKSWLKSWVFILLFKLISCPIH